MLTAFEDYLALPNDLKDQIVKLGGPKMADIFAKLEETFKVSLCINFGIN